jgi:iron complex outermembrane receptor protein
MIISRARRAIRGAGRSTNPTADRSTAGVSARRTPAVTAAAVALAVASATAALRVPPSGAASAASDTLGRVVPIPGIEVSTDRPGDRAPIARTVIGRAEVQRLNWGQDTPLALATLPGAYAYSDAGNGIGYSYLSIRGFPQRRISVLVNGVPLNDPQSHEVYWIDHPDLLASAAEVQVQRGIGSALYGAASVGGSVNLETSPFTDTPRTALAVGYGSYETKRLSFEQNSGRLAGDWWLYGRYSRVETAGYRERAWSKLWSYAFSARKVAGDHVWKANLYGGPEETHLSYLGVGREYLEGRVTGDRDRDRRFNPITYANERDHFFEPHYELIHTWTPRPEAALTQTLFWFDGKGFYDERRFGEPLAGYRLASWATTDSTLAAPGYYLRDASGALVVDGQGRYTVVATDLARRRTVENRHFGWIPRVRLAHAGGALTVGGELRFADGRHGGEVLWASSAPPGAEPNHAYYDYHPRTRAAGVFVREEWNPRGDLLVTADLAWRHQSYRMRGDRFDGIRFDQPYHFALPRLGLTWSPRPAWSAFASIAHARREPAFRDLYDAEGVGSVPLYRVRDVASNVYEDPLVRPERVTSAELGGAWRAERAAASVNLFRMDFRDELVGGQFDVDLGYLRLANAARSVHQGVEWAARAEPPAWRGATLTLEGNASLSDHHLVRASEQVPFPGALQPDTLVTFTYDGNTIGQFPSVLANLTARISGRRGSLAAEVQHAGRMYLDQSEDRAASLDPRTVVSLIGTARVPGTPAEVSLRIQNALNLRYEAGGYSYWWGGVKNAEFIPAATRHWIAEVRLEF